MSGSFSLISFKPLVPCYDIVAFVYKEDSEITETFKGIFQIIKPFLVYLSRIPEPSLDVALPFISTVSIRFPMQFPSGIRESRNS